MPRAPLLVTLAAFALGLLALTAAPASALEVWSGRTYTFTRPDNVDWTLAQYQDRITPVVWITRKLTQGIFNIAQEAGYNSFSPAGTEWATGNAVDYASLTFQSWVNWAGGNPPSTVGVDAVVHLIAADIYVDIRFLSWTAISGGGFSYVRAVQPPPVGTESSTWGRIKSLYR